MTISTRQNIFSNIPSELPEELFETLHQQNNIRIERIVSKGHHNAENEWYEQVQDEWVLLLQGQAKLEFEDPASIRLLNPGDFIFIPAFVRHRVAWTLKERESIWLAIHVFPENIE